MHIGQDFPHYKSLLPPFQTNVEHKWIASAKTCQSILGSPGFPKDHLDRVAMPSLSGRPEKVL